MATDRNKIIERIRALRAKADDAAATVDEAAQAAEMAARLLTKHEISASELQEEADSVGASGSKGTGKNLHPILYYTAWAIQYFTETKAFFQGPEAVFVGVDSDVEMAVYLSEMLLATGKRMWIDEAATLGKMNMRILKHKRESFFMGFGREISLRLQDIADKRFEQRKTASKSESSALVVVKSEIAKAKLEEMGIRLRKGRNRSYHPDADMLRKGFEAGSKVNLERPLNSGRTGAGELT